MDLPLERLDGNKRNRVHMKPFMKFSERAGVCGLSSVRSWRSPVPGCPLSRDPALRKLQAQRWE